MNRKIQFKQLLDDAKSIEDPKMLEWHYIGTGNPNADILIVGKEVAFDETTDEGQKQYEREFIDHFSNWERDIDKAASDIADCDGSNYSPLYPYKGQCKQIDNWKKSQEEGHNKGTNRTWYNYQKLTNYIFDQPNNDKIDFHERVFITEMNSSPSAKTKDASKESVDFRKKYFKHEFFRSFPIVIVAGLGKEYYMITPERNDIEETFGVKFIKKVPGEKHSQSFWIHTSSNPKKIVINTRQLSMNTSNELLEKISKTIKAWESGDEDFDVLFME